MIGGAVDLGLVEENWDEVLRLAASIRAGTVPPSVILRKIAAFPRQNALSKALREIGRVERSIFMADWLMDLELRRRSHANLNKGESRHALARAVFFHRLGELRDRTAEAMAYRASGLNLVVNAIILWNTTYLARTLNYVRGQASFSPTNCCRTWRPSNGITSRSPVTISGPKLRDHANASGRCAPTALTQQASASLSVQSCRDSHAPPVPVGRRPHRHADRKKPMNRRRVAHDPATHR